MITPFPYFGSKSKAAKEIWKRLGDPKLYCEPFGGSLGCLLNRPQWGDTRIEVVNDIDHLLTNFWRSVKYHYEELTERTQYPINEIDLYARHKFLVSQKETLREKMENDPYYTDVELAAFWCYGMSIWIGGGFCQAETASRVGKKVPASNLRGINRQKFTEIPKQKWKADAQGCFRNLNLEDYFNELSHRLNKVKILCGSWSRCLTPSITTRYGTVGILLDPPYNSVSGRVDNLYACDSKSVSDEAYKWAIENCSNHKVRIAFCCYENDYNFPSDWSEFIWKSVGNYKNGSKERIYFSPHCLKD